MGALGIVRNLAIIAGLTAGVILVQTVYRQVFRKRKVRIIQAG
jgi:hypothetical protein